MERSSDLRPCCWCAEGGERWFDCATGGAAAGTEWQQDRPNTSSPTKRNVSDATEPLRLNCAGTRDHADWVCHRPRYCCCQDPKSNQQPLRLLLLLPLPLCPTSSMTSAADQQSTADSFACGSGNSVGLKYARRTWPWLFLFFPLNIINSKSPFSFFLPRAITRSSLSNDPLHGLGCDAMHLRCEPPQQEQSGTYNLFVSILISKQYWGLDVQYTHTMAAQHSTAQHSTLVFVYGERRDTQRRREWWISFSKKAFQSTVVVAVVAGGSQVLCTLHWDDDDEDDDASKVLYGAVWRYTRQILFFTFAWRRRRRCGEDAVLWPSVYYCSRSSTRPDLQAGEFRCESAGGQEASLNGQTQLET